MIYVLCSNDIGDNKLFAENDNFQCVILEEHKKTALSMNSTLKFNLYYALDEDFENLVEIYGESDTDDDYSYTEIPYLNDFIGIVADKITDYYKKYLVAAVEDEDAPNIDLMVVSVLPGKTGSKIVKGINAILRKNNVDITIINVYTMLGCSDIGELTTVLKKRLGTDFIYPEDPFHFSYAIYKTLGIGSAR